MVKPPGSTRATLACSAPSPPQREMRAGMPAAKRTASPESTSTSISSWLGSPTSIKVCPMATGMLLSIGRLRMRPAAGAVTDNTLPVLSVPAAARPSSCNKARAAVRRALAACSSARATPHSACAASWRVRAWSSSCFEMAPLGCSDWARCQSACARRWLAWAALLRLRAASSWAWALRTSACAWLRARGSSKELAAASISASVWPACTASPGCRAMRRTVPATGAVIT